MSVLPAPEIRRRIFEERDDRRRLYITPLLEPEEQLRGATTSLDIRLGTAFITTRRTEFSHIDPFGLRDEGMLKTDEQIRGEFSRYQEEIYVPFAGEFVLHPHQFVLGCTLEYFRFPLDMAAYVIGRSSWGRLGLVIATATVVHPGYTGVLTLELENLGDAPIVLVTGARIGQLVLHAVQDPGASSYSDVYSSKYVAAVKPSHSLIYKDSERQCFSRYRELVRGGTGGVAGVEERH